MSCPLHFLVLHSPPISRSERLVRHSTLAFTFAYMELGIGVETGTGGGANPLAVHLHD